MNSKSIQVSYDDWLNWKLTIDFSNIICILFVTTMPMIIITVKNKTIFDYKYIYLHVLVTPSILL